MNATPDDGRSTGAGPTGSQPRRRRSARRDQGPPVTAPQTVEQAARVEPGKAETPRAQAPEAPAADSPASTNKSGGDPKVQATPVGNADNAEGQRGRKRNKPRHRVEGRNSDRTGADGRGAGNPRDGSPRTDIPSTDIPGSDNPSTDRRGRHEAPVPTPDPAETIGRSPHPNKTADHGQPKRRSRVRDRSHQEAEPVDTASDASTERGAGAPPPEQPRRDWAGQDRVRQESQRSPQEKSAASERTRPDSPGQEPPRPEPAKQEPVRYEPPVRTNRDRRAEVAERALRNLVSTRSTQISWASSIRARDYAAPTAEDLAEAAEELVIVQRHYTPAEPLQGKGRARPEQSPGRFTNKRGN